MIWMSYQVCDPPGVPDLEGSPASRTWEQQKKSIADWMYLALGEVQYPLIVDVARLQAMI